MTDVLTRMPKVELHVHLEGTIAPETLWEMAARNHVALPVGTLAELRALYAFEGFDKFLDLRRRLMREFEAAGGALGL
jgi:adenine deaminase